MSDELNILRKLDARLALDQRLRQCARRSARPGPTRLEARLAAGGSLVEVTLVGSCAVQGRVRTVLVVPAYEEGDFTVERAASHRDDAKQACAFALQRADKSLHHSDASRLPDRALAVADVVALAPRREAGASELRAAVAGQIPL